MDALVSLEAFISSMLEWEKERIAAIKSEPYKEGDSVFRRLEDEKSREKLSSIIEKHLTPRALATLGAAKIETMGVGRPPIYDQSIVEVSNVGADVAIICEPSSGGLLAQFVRYTLVKSNNEWRIDQVHSSSNKKDWRKNNSI